MNYADYSRLPGVSFSQMKGPINAPEKALIFGTLFDNLVLTPHLIDHGNYEVEGRPFTEEMLNACKKMRDVLFGRYASGYFVNPQQIFTSPLTLEYAGKKFEITGKCKYDFSFGDLKSTDAKTQQAFELSIPFFDYDGQRAWYMDVSGRDVDYLIGVSKHYPHRVFTVKVVRGDAIYASGRAKYIELAFSYWAKYGS